MKSFDDIPSQKEDIPNKYFCLSFKNKNNDQNSFENSFENSFQNINAEQNCFFFDILTPTSNFNEYQENIFSKNKLDLVQSLNSYLFSEEEFLSPDNIKYVSVVNNFQVDENSKDKSTMVYAYSSNNKKEKLDNKYLPRKNKSSCRKKH